MAVVDLSNFEPVQVGDLPTGFYTEVKRKKDQPKKKLILLRTPKSIKAADLDGVELNISGSKTSVKSSIFQSAGSAVAGAASERKMYRIMKGMDGEQAPVVVALPAHGKLSLEKAFSEVWHMGVVTDEPAYGRLEVDLEDDIGGRSWRQVKQATNLREPISAFEISMSKPTVVKASATASPSPKKTKKRKHTEQH